MDFIGIRKIPIIMCGFSRVQLNRTTCLSAAKITRADAHDADDRFEKLENWSRDLISALGKETHRWSGQVLDTIDYAGFIGRDPGGKNIYVAMGDSGQGMTHGVAGAMLNAGLILGENHPWKDVYFPGRVPLKAAKNFMAENVTALKSFAEYVAPGEIGSLDELKCGNGAIVR